ncbi:PQQ-dependent sugar dehydrogenase [Nocardioides sp. ChNu-153]|uniref:PQQ-dependent sugar dehydrogenase n=1 Tax=unclassified Nocardioides TaxID=2615069 RepID=UPI0024067802|nr:MULTISPECIES: PQQ-dependent sugar dehydrogenase [unclassified Nocardioides]MDF9715999.1 PQQ-dependent sugar dehydrogenase [Nocardioides sp. ChNu-99]MDN7119967.1 PQQ-dependent sugar dehydrogenase [Nocardioides sp. ChNu-153]
MRPSSRATAVAVAVATALVTLTACSGEESAQEADSPVITPSDGGSAATTPASPTGTPTTAAPAPVPEPTGDVTTGLETPWDVAFLPDGRAVVPERDTGDVLLVAADGTTTDAGDFPEAENEDESGLLGVAVSPDFAQDRTLFFYLTTDEDNRVVRRVLDADGTLGAQTDVLTGIPSANRHDGGRLTFGPDGMLYVSTGDAGEEGLAQDADSLAGKILRVTPDGAPAPDNPDPTSPVLSMGHRNVQGLAFDDDGRLWATEFGADTADELNLVEPGGNYGWPEVEGTGGTDRGFVDPQLTWPTDEASPSGLAYTDGTLWMAALRGERLWRVSVADGRASDPTAYLTGTYGRLRQVRPAPDGSLWLLTNNTDGRVEPRPGDDRIVRLALR